jgi:hypothetical protein
MLSMSSLLLSLSLLLLLTDPCTCMWCHHRAHPEAANGDNDDGKVDEGDDMSSFMSGSSTAGDDDDDNTNNNISSAPPAAAASTFGFGFGFGAAPVPPTAPSVAAEYKAPAKYSTSKKGTKKQSKKGASKGSSGSNKGKSSNTSSMAGVTAPAANGSSGVVAAKKKKPVSRKPGPGGPRAVDSRKGRVSKPIAGAVMPTREISMATGGD